MKATEVLMNEHRVIELVLTCLEKLADQTAKERKLDGVAARRIIDFFQNFADKCHHGKEEEHLFPMMEARGFPRHGGPTGVMLHEHEEGRSLIRGMLASLPDATEAKAAAVARFVQSARGFVAHLRLHILKEDSRLFPMADHALTEDDQERLLEVFGHKEEHDLGAGTHEKYLELARELAKQFQVATASGSSLHVVCGSCGH